MGAWPHRAFPAGTWKKVLGCDSGKPLKLRHIAADQDSGRTGYRVLNKHPMLARLGKKPKVPLRRENGGIMDINRAEALRKELGQLLRKQTEVLESRTFGAATDTDILEYEIRQEIIHEMCNQLANSDATA
jgi:hypothetical protein